MSEHTRQDDSLLAAHIEDEMKQYKAILDRLETMEHRMEDIVDIWTQAKGVITFIKVMAWAGATVTSIYLFVTSNFVIAPK